MSPFRRTLNWFIVSHRASSEFLHLAEKTQKCDLCNSMIYLHKIWHNDADGAFQVHRPLKMKFQNPR